MAEIHNSISYGINKKTIAKTDKSISIRKAVIRAWKSEELIKTETIIKTHLQADSTWTSLGVQAACKWVFLVYGMAIKISQRKKEHTAFLQSTEWAQIRVDLFIERGKKCEICGSGQKIQVHHLTYERFGGDEEPDDLIILCGHHHMVEHDLREISKHKKPRKRKRPLSECRRILIKKFNLPNKKLRGWAGIARFIQEKKGKKPIPMKKPRAITYVQKYIDSIA